MAGIYFHIPFCKQACHYCDFHFSTNVSVRKEMTEAMVKELLLQKDYLGRQEINTLYFGGGTPSLLTTQELSLLLTSVRNSHQVAADAEVTLEANPDDLTHEKLRDMRDLGINRLSIGIQSFDDAVLKQLNRAHDAAAAMHCVEDARKAGFTNISVDLIYAIPGQDEMTWKKNIEQALAFNPEHISSYSLTIEEKTVFGKWAATGKLHPVEDDHAAQQLEILVAELMKAGYDQYEVSNFGKPGFWSRHNSSYWRQQQYLGIGPSAHSFNGHSRQFNVRNNSLYLRALQQGTIPFEAEILSREDQINEYILTTLRTSWGCDVRVLKAAYDFDLIGQNHSYVNRLLGEGLATLTNDHLYLTPRGRLLADKISSDLFVE